jgi:hypothetical protein
MVNLGGCFELTLGFERDFFVDKVVIKQRGGAKLTFGFVGSLLFGNVVVVKLEWCAVLTFGFGGDFLGSAKLLVDWKRIIEALERSRRVRQLPMRDSLGLMASPRVDVPSCYSSRPFCTFHIA